MFDIRVNDISVVCSGSFISGNKLITAAHCFDHLVSLNCLEDTSCSAQKLFINNKIHKFQVSLHPNYRPKRSMASYQSSSNFDLAVLELANINTSNYFDVFTGQLDKSKPLEFFGYGMQSLKMKNVGDRAYYQEQGRGRLTKGRVASSVQSRGVLVSSQSHVLLDQNNKSIKPKISQVLRSDSGGPLIMDRKIVGVIRNYQISDALYEASASSQPELVNKSLKIQSTFTILSHESTKQFLSTHK